MLNRRCVVGFFICCNITVFILLFTTICACVFLISVIFFLMSGVVIIIIGASHERCSIMSSDFEVLLECFELVVSGDEFSLGSKLGRLGLFEFVLESVGDLVIFSVIFSVILFASGKSSTILDDVSDMSSILFLF